MTYQALLNKLQKLTPKQLAQPVTLMEGCSGNWTTVSNFEIATKDEYPDECAPGERRYQAFVQDGITPPAPAVKKGHVYLLHDH